MELKRRKIKITKERSSKSETTVNLIKVTFRRGRNYTFKTIIPDLKEGDKVIVRTRDGITLANVFQPDSKYNPTINYNWILGKFDTKKIEADFLERLKQLGIEE